MAIIGRLKYEADSDRDLVWKHESDNLVLGTQVVVNEGQEVVFVKGGRALDVLGPGTHTLSTANLPILQNLINLPFGGKTPFTAEVFYVNRHVKMDVDWGTDRPIQVTDPQYKIIVPIRAWGQFGVRVRDSRLLVTQLVATIHSWSSGDLKRYFAGLLIQRLKETIAAAVVKEHVGVLQLTAHLEELSRSISGPVRDEMKRWGLEVVNLYVASITVPEDDPSVMKLREALATRAEIDQLGEGYRLKRTFDVLETSAGNPSGLAGTLLSGGLGAGIGFGAGPTLGAHLATAMMPAFPGVAGGPAGLRVCVHCGAAAPGGANFCSSCGAPAQAARPNCAGCGAPLPADSKFCPKCGKKVE